ncbi:hypothetical protein S245_001610 [Arachis hypogaea]
MVCNPSIQFMIYESSLKRLKARSAKKQGGVTALEVFLLGALAKLASTISTCLLLVVKVKPYIYIYIYEAIMSMDVVLHSFKEVEFHTFDSCMLDNYASLFYS